MGNCLYCKKITKNKKYCNYSCQMKHRHQDPEFSKKVKLALAICDKTRSKEYKERKRLWWENYFKTHNNWARGLTKETDERIKKRGLAQSKTKKQMAKDSILNCFSLGHIVSEETKRNMRLARINYISKYGRVYPNYNPKACEFFKSFDEQNNTRGQYAFCDEGEHFIQELGYFLDYINFDKKLIMEYDEPHHYENGILKDKDKIRQKQVQALYSDFEFRRIKQ